MYKEFQNFNFNLNNSVTQKRCMWHVKTVKNPTCTFRMIDAGLKTKHAFIMSIDISHQCMFLSSSPSETQLTPSNDE